MRTLFKQNPKVKKYKPRPLTRQVASIDLDRKGELEKFRKWLEWVGKEKSNFPEKDEVAKISKDAKSARASGLAMLGILAAIPAITPMLGNLGLGNIGNGIKGLIRGTSTLGDLLNNVLNKLSDAFLNLAIFGNFGGGSVTGGLLGMFGFANGGRPPVGRPSVVGERGPELFVPDRAGTIVPNHELGGMGGTNIVVNVDASGSNVEGDEEEGRQLGIALSAAIESELIKQKRPGGLLA